MFYLLIYCNTAEYSDVKIYQFDSDLSRYISAKRQTTSYTKKSSKNSVLYKSFIHQKLVAHTKKHKNHTQKNKLK